MDRYRQYDADGNQVKGDYAKIFEEEYRRLAKHPDYQSLFKEVDMRTAAEEVHNGYFSIDKKKVGGKTVEVFKDTRGDTKADDDTYSLIMRDKEKLLGFRDATQIHFLPFRTEGRLGQSERLPDLRPARHGHRTGTPTDDWPRLASVRQPAGRTVARF